MAITELHNNAKPHNMTGSYREVVQRHVNSVYEEESLHTPDIIYSDGRSSSPSRIVIDLKRYFGSAMFHYSQGSLKSHVVPASAPTNYYDLDLPMLLNEDIVQIFATSPSSHTSNDFSGGATALQTFINQLDEVKAQLSLSITQLATLFDVTRKTIYDWYDGIVPRANVKVKMEILKDLLTIYAKDIDVSRLRFLWQIPLNNSESLLQVFNNDNYLIDDSLHQRLKQKFDELVPRLSKSKGNDSGFRDARLGVSQLNEHERNIDGS